MDDETEASKISIHALREEGDLVRLCRKAPVPNFYPRPPRGGRQSNTAEDIAEMEFLSTPSARRATDDVSVEDAAQIFLSTPSARRATPPNSSRCPCTCRPFLSTPSARRATAP